MRTVASKSRKAGSKFIRRSDLTSRIRLFIAFTALQAQQNTTWGVITGLARTYAIVYSCLVDELRVFDDAGQLRDRQEAEGNIEAALDFLDTLGVESITAAVKKVRRTCRTCWPILTWPGRL